MYRLIMLSVVLCSSIVHAGEFSPATPMPAIELSEGQLINRIAIGSCAKPDLDQSIFGTIAKTRSDAFMLIGDNVYAEDESDDPSLQSLKEAYGAFAESEPFKQLRDSTPMLVTWDDHDYGLNDAGGDWPHKEASEALYEYVWAVPKKDPRRSRPGVYFERTVGPIGRRVQFIMLDTRFFRSHLEESSKKLDNGYYEQQPGKNEVLGAAQWAWLEDVLQKPADVRVIASSIQVIATGHNWEAWHLMPDERAKFFGLLNRVKPNGVVLVSGDRHSAALYRETTDVPYPIWELTSSSLNLPLTAIKKDIVDEPGELRQGVPYYDANFGIIDVDWVKQKLILQIRDSDDRAVLAATVNLADLTSK